MSDTVTTYGQPMDDAPGAANGPPAAAGADASDGAAVAQPMAVGDSESDSAAGGGASDEHAVWSDVFKVSCECSLTHI